MAEDDKELYRVIGRMEAKIDSLVAKVELLEKKVEDLSNQKNTSYGIFLAARSAWIAGAAVLGAFSTNIIGWLLHR
jgi:hypothetical protein